jgi:hypothetical protein
MNSDLLKHAIKNFGGTKPNRGAACARGALTRREKAVRTLSTYRQRELVNRPV